MRCDMRESLPPERGGRVRDMLRICAAGFADLLARLAGLEPTASASAGLRSIH